MHEQALIILPGITASRGDRAHLRQFFHSKGDYEVLLPLLWQAGGIDCAAWQLVWFMRRWVIAQYRCCHFLCYISGGFILRKAISLETLPNIGRIVYLRSPLQERVPGLFIARYGALAAAICHGKMLFDLASRQKDALPVIAAEDGVILETGISQMAVSLGLAEADYAIARHSSEFCLPPAREIVTTVLNHDQVYSNGALLAAIAEFLRSGRFFAASSDIIRREEAR